MPVANKILYLHDFSGALVAAQIPAHIWRQIEPHLPDILQKNQNQNLPETDSEGFAEFISAWTFPYPYDPAVSCPGCQAKTADWQNDPAKPFKLASANISGHLVFHCKKCGGTIRQKHFKDHQAVEFTPPDSAICG